MAQYEQWTTRQENASDGPVFFSQEHLDFFAFAESRMARCEQAHSGLAMTRSQQGGNQPSSRVSLERTSLSSEQQDEHHQSQEKTTPEPQTDAIEALSANFDEAIPVQVDAVSEPVELEVDKLGNGKSQTPGRRDGSPSFATTGQDERSSMDPDDDSFTPIIIEQDPQEQREATPDTEPPEESGLLSRTLSPESLHSPIEQQPAAAEPEPEQQGEEHLSPDLRTTTPDPPVTPKQPTLTLSSADLQALLERAEAQVRSVKETLQQYEGRAKQAQQAVNDEVPRLIQDCFRICHTLIEPEDVEHVLNFSPILNIKDSALSAYRTLVDESCLYAAHCYDRLDEIEAELFSVWLESQYCSDGESEEAVKVHGFSPSQNQQTDDANNVQDQQEVSAEDHPASDTIEFGGCLYDISTIDVDSPITSDDMDPGLEFALMLFEALLDLDCEQRKRRTERGQRVDEVVAEMSRMPDILRSSQEAIGPSIIWVEEEMSKIREFVGNYP